MSLARPHSEQLKELRERVRAHPGTIARIQWDALRGTYTVFIDNYQELAALLETARRPDVAIEMVQNVHEPTARDKVGRQLDQRLHNFVASAGALVDHSRRLTDRYDDPAFRTGYEAKKATFVASPAAGFIKGLRNFLLHRQLPPKKYVLRDLSTNPTSDVLLPCGSLLEHDRWSPETRAWITGQPEGISMREVTDRYAELTEPMYAWLFEQFPLLHGADVDARNEMVDEFNRLLTGRSGPWSPTELER